MSKLVSRSLAVVGDIVDTVIFWFDNATSSASYRATWLVIRTKLESYFLLLSDVIDEDTMSSNSASKVPTQQSTKAYIDASIAAAVVGLLDPKGDYNASTNSPDLDTSPSGVLKGDAYVVTTAGTFFATAVNVGDWMYAKQDSPTLVTHWTIVPGTLNAAAVLALLLTVDGSGSGVDADLVDGNEAAALLARANHTGTQTASTISDFSTAADARVTAVAGVGVQHEYFDCSKQHLISNTCSAVTFQTASGTNNETPYFYQAYDGTTQEFGAMYWKPPKRWNLGAIRARFVWKEITGASSKGVFWVLGAKADGDTDNFGSDFSVYGSILDTCSAGDIKQLLISGWTATFTPSGSPAAGDLISFILSRDPTNAGDTLNGIDAQLLGVEIEWTATGATDA